MNTPIGFQQLQSLCSGCRVYCAALNGACDSAIYAQLKNLPQRVSCLYKGINEVPTNSHWEYPYLVELQDDSFSQWLFENGWGKHWGIFIGTNASFPLLRNQLSQLVFSKANAQNFSKLFDPKFMREWLPSCNPHQLDRLFKYVTYYWMEKENRRPIYFYRNSRAEGARYTPRDFYAPYGRKLQLVMES